MQFSQSIAYIFPPFHTPSKPYMCNNQEYNRKSKEITRKRDKNRTVLTTKTRENGKIHESIEGRRRRGRNHCGVINRGGAYREIQGKEKCLGNN